MTDEIVDGNALIPFQHGMGLISDKLYEVFASHLFNCFKVLNLLTSDLF